MLHPKHNETTKTQHQPKQRISKSSDKPNINTAKNTIKKQTETHKETNKASEKKPTINSKIINQRFSSSINPNL